MLICFKASSEKQQKAKLMEFIKNIIQFIIVRKKYWLIPLILALLFLTALIIMVETAPVLPAIYPIF